MKNYGLLGKKLAHSYSPQIHDALGLVNYELFEIAENAVAEFLEQENLQGLNVTIPYKKTVIPYCKSLSESAEKIGSVNTMLRNTLGEWEGHNTDYFGFLYLLERAKIHVKNKKVLVFGSGGSSLTVCTALKDLHVRELVVISRTGENTYDNLNKHADAEIVIQTSPVGMYPENHEKLIELSNFPKCEGVVDIIYNPLRTHLILEARERNIPSIGGLAMLVAQAKKASELFQNKKISADILDTLINKLEKQVSNIILIGMPGCGKTTLGSQVAEKLGRPFIDIDEEIERRFDISPSTIIKEQGEMAFREYEHALIVEFGKQSGLVIATGGGVVMKQENYAPLAQQGTIIWIQRDVNLLPIHGRPLSEQHGLPALYTQRKALYEKFASLIIENKNKNETINKILEVCA